MAQERPPGKDGRERTTSPERRPFRVTPEVGRFFIAATVAPEFYDARVVITDANEQRLRRELDQATFINLRPAARSMGTHLIQTGHNEGKSVAELEGDLEPLIRHFTAKTIERGSTPGRKGRKIDMAGIRDDLMERYDQFPVNDPIYAALSQAIVQLPRTERRYLIDQALLAARYRPQQDLEMFSQLHRHAQAIKREAGAATQDTGEMLGRLDGLRETRRGASGGRGMTRRGWFRVAAAGAVVAAGGSYLLWGRGGGGDPELSAAAERERFRNPFTGPEANTIAQSFGINEGTFWTPNESVMARIGKTSTFLADQEMLPIYPAAVVEKQGEEQTEQRKALTWAATNTDSSMPTRVPVNVLATVATIESAGNTNPPNGGANAYGMMQVVPGYHLDTIVNVAQEISGQVINGKQMPVIDVQEAAASVDQWKARKGQAAVDFGNSLPDAQKALTNPYVAAKVGAVILQQNYLQAREGQKNPPLTNPVDTWVVALGVYNGGPGIITEPFVKQPAQTQRYQVYAQRFFMTAEIAAQLRKRGMSDTHIAQQLISEETNARAYAYDHVASNAQGTAYAPLLANMANDKATTQEQMKGYTILWNGLNQPTIMVDPDTVVNHTLGVTADAASQLTTDLQRAYADYVTKKAPQYHVPVSPGLRMWLNHGGISLFESVPQNDDPSNYAANQK